MNLEINLILTLAGKYSRFRRKGYKVPKFLLPTYTSNHMLVDIVQNLKSSFANINAVFVFAVEDERFISEKVKNAISIFDKNSFRFIDYNSGQAVSAYEGVRQMKMFAKKRKKDLSIVAIANGDTVYKVDWTKIINIFKKNDNCVSVIDTFSSDSEDYSYVAIDKKEKVIDMQEKKVISPFASTGLHCYRDVDTFLYLYENTELSGGEFHLSGLVKGNCDKDQFYINKNDKCSKILDLGTPDKYMNYLKNG